MTECIFCNIAKKQMPSKIVYEDEYSIAFLDLMPRSKGMCLVIPKKHFQNFDDDLELSKKTFESALIVGKKIKQSLQPLSVFFSIMEGQVPHFHIRVYPVYQDQIPLLENKPLKIDEGELNLLAEKIKGIEVEKIETEPEEAEEVIEVAEPEQKEELEEKPKQKKQREMEMA